MDTQETRIFTAIIISVILIGVILIVFFISLIRQHKQNLKLHKSITLAELSAMEKERARIANDLHDELSPVLSVVKFQIDSVSIADPDEAVQLKSASTYLDNMLQLVREISNNLMPGTLIRKGFIAALEEFTNRVAASGQLKITFICSDEVSLPEEVSINLYRALQEAIHNALKHAQADFMEIRIEVKKGTLTILCKDNGIGFDLALTAKQSKGLGLTSLRNRAALMGGRLTIESQTGRGTALLFEIPLI